MIPPLPHPSGWAELLVEKHWHQAFRVFLEGCICFVILLDNSRYLQLFHQVILTSQSHRETF
jgi:hypothetical protein